MGQAFRLISRLCLGMPVLRALQVLGGTGILPIIQDCRAGCARPYFSVSMQPCTKWWILGSLLHLSIDPPPPVAAHNQVRGGFHTGNGIIPCSNLSRAKYSKYTMLANYGYSDGSGSYFITIDTDKCDGCGDCVPTCPASCFEMLTNDPNDPLSDRPVAAVVHDKVKKLKYECGPCKHPSHRPPLPCVEACTNGAICHSW